eukprot:m.110412 g.110412  ORF g.110412 m.110412 type:complete len:176 (+) comp14037_c0_seq4:4646-5173(+)
MMPVIGAGPEVLGIEGCTEAVGTFSGIPCPGSGGRSNEPEAVGRVGAALDVELDVLGTLFAEDFGIVPELLVNKGVACDLGCCSGSGGIEPLLLIEVLEIVGAVDVGSGGKSSNPPPAVDPRRGRLATGSAAILDFCHLHRLSKNLLIMTKFIQYAILDSGSTVTYGRTLLALLY